MWLSVSPPYGTLEHSSQEVVHVAGGCYEIINSHTRGFAFQLYGQSPDSLAKLVACAHYRRIFRDVIVYILLRTRIFTANVWLNDFATQLYRIFLKTNIFLKTELKKLIRSEFRT